MVRQVVVVFYRLEGGRFAEKAKVVDWYWVWKETLQSFKHSKAGAEYRDQSNSWRDSFGRVSVVERGFSLDSGL